MFIFYKLKDSLKFCKIYKFTTPPKMTGTSYDSLVKKYKQTNHSDFVSCCNCVACTWNLFRAYLYSQRWNVHLPSVFVCCRVSECVSAEPEIITPARARIDRRHQYLISFFTTAVMISHFLSFKQSRPLVQSGESFRRSVKLTCWADGRLERQASKCSKLW